MSTETDALGAERDAARAEVSQLRAKIEKAEALLDKHKRSPHLGAAVHAEFRAALAEPLGSTPEQEQAK